MQKKIEIPCIFGDRSLILKALENESGMIKLPLFILQSTEIKSDSSRNADLHVDVFYQQDDAFHKLPENHPLYRPYALSKRRGLPIIIEYTLTLIAKYKEDLDQMCTNWMVHYRPDIYVKWWHPRNTEAPLESEILWSQNINIDSPVENSGTEKFQWKASTSFTYKTWLFPGLNYLEDALNADNEKLIEYFNYFPWTYYPGSGNETDGSGLVSGGVSDGFPVFGDLLNRENAGFFAVDRDQGFENNGDDPQGILKGKYAVNNVESNPSSILYDSVSGILQPNEPMVKDILGMADIPSNIGLLNSYPTFNIYQDYLVQDPIRNEAFGFKYVYFKGGFPLSAFVSTPSSGDYLFNYFYSEQPKRLNNLEYTTDIVSTEFGKSFTDMLTPRYDYNLETKDLNIYGEFKNERYYSYIGSLINSSTGIKQIIKLNNFNSEKPINIEFIRGIDNNFLINNSLTKNNLEHINLWNDKFKEWNETNIRFKIEYDSIRMKLYNLKQLIDMYWDNLNLKYLDDGNNTYELECSNATFFKIIDNLNCTKDGLTILWTKQIIKKDNITYTLILNNFLYFVLKSEIFITEEGEEEFTDDIIDYGIISLPEFGYHCNPVFNVTYPEAGLVYGISIKTSLGIN